MNVHDRAVIAQVMNGGLSTLGDQALIKHAMDGALNVAAGTTADVLVVDETARRLIQRHFANGDSETINETVTQRRWGLRVTR